MRDDLGPGDLAVGTVHAIREGQLDRKPRPVVIVKPLYEGTEQLGWWVMGLTTKPAWLNGIPRTPIKYPNQAGLAGPGYIFSYKLVPLGWGDLYTKIGKLTWHDVRTVGRVMQDRKFSDVVKLYRAGGNPSA